MLRSELYASTCILGGACYIALDALDFSGDLSVLIAICVTLPSRLFAIKWDLELSNFSKV